MKFAEPAWLAILLLLPFFVAGAILTARLRRKQWSAFAAPRLRPKLLRRGSPVPRWLAFGFLMLAVALLAIGMARPQTTRGAEAELSRGRNVLLALDLSRSMLVTDLKPDRLTQAKTLCYELMEALPADRIGLVGFSGEPYLFAPLTVDHAAVRETIQQLDMDFIPVGGSNLEKALNLSIKTLKETGQKENALILLTDGDETIGRMSELAAEAKRAGVYVFAIAIGTEQGDFVPNKDFPDGRHRDESNRPVRSALNTTVLKKLASETGGRFAVATSAASIPEMVKTAISDMEQFEIEGRERFVPVEYYQYFIFPGIVMLIASIIAGTRWRALGPASTAAAAAALLLFSPQAARADVEKDARQALAEGKNEQAADLFGALADKAEDRERGFRFRLAQGNAYYRQGNLEKARHAFSEALRSQDPQVRAASHHGMGTVLFGTGWKSLSAGQAYPEVAKQESDKPKSNPFKKIVDSILGLLGKPPEGDQKPGQMEAFDGMVRQALSEWMQDKAPEEGESNGFVRFDTTLTDWVDAVTHFDSALRYDPSLELAKHNRTLTVKYLKRLEEILNEVSENASQIQPMPMPGPGQGEGKQPEGQGEEGDQPGEGENGDQPGKGKGEDGEEEGGSGGDQENDKEGKGGDRPADKKDEGKGGSKAAKPGESPEDTARRIVRENADFEKGVLGPGRLEYRQPEKDW